MASHVINLRRTLIGSIAVVLLVMQFTHKGGPADVVADQMVKAAKAPIAGRTPDEIVTAAATAPAIPNAATAAWYAPSAEGHSDDDPAPPPRPNSNSGEASTFTDHPVIHKAAPRGVDFPENG